MRYRLDISDEALEQLRALPKDQRQRIGQKLDALQTDLQGDVKKLAGQEGKYRCAWLVSGALHARKRPDLRSRCEGPQRCLPRLNNAAPCAAPRCKA